MAKVICEFSDSADISEDLNSKFIKHSRGGMKNRCKLIPTEYDRAVFEKIMNDEPVDEDEEKSILYQNYIFFREKIAVSRLKMQQLYDALYKLKIVRILLHEGENPQEIFESLNSTGKDLTDTELIQNYLLLNLNWEVQENLYKKYWLPMEKMLRNSETIENFMFYYLTIVLKSEQSKIKGKHIQVTKKTIYTTFKKYFDSKFNGDKNEKVEEILKNMYSYAKFFSRLIAIENENFENLSALEKKFYELMYQINSFRSIVILMDLNNKYENFLIDKPAFMQMVDALISLIFRSKVCRQSGLDSLSNAMNILDNFDKSQKFDIDSFWAAMIEGRHSYACPNDEQFKMALVNPELRMIINDDCKYILYKLEKNLNNKNAGLFYEKYSLNYVMPKKLNETWVKYLRVKNDLENHEIYLNALGNLVLTDDLSQENAFFLEKIENYAASNLFYTKSLRYSLDWTSRQIINRSQALAELALKVWKVPEKYAKSISFKEIYYNLDSDFSIFTGRKPDILSSLGREIYGIKSWHELIREVLNDLYEMDEKIFVESAANFISTKPDDYKGPIKIADGNFYIDANRDTKTLLNRLKTIVEKFEKIFGENFKDEILFTIKY